MQPAPLRGRTRTDSTYKRGQTGEQVSQWGTRDAIKRDGMEVDAPSLAYCPHEWINDAGCVRDVKSHQ
nr:hypothetical protein CIT39_05145 [Bradyrhizobium symbiodeficiens]QDF36268.1 hypothetical protein FJN17_01110 [Bradyrhizobium symbiodeficiens]